MVRLILIAIILASPLPSFGQTVVSLRLVASLDGHTDQVSRVVFSTDGKLITSCSHDGTVRLWDVETKKSLATLHVQDKPLYALALSPDNKTLATAGIGGILTLWNVESRLKTNTYEQDEAGVTDIAWSPDGNAVILKKGLGLVIVPTNYDKPKVVKFDHDIFWATVGSSMAVDRDGDRIAVGGDAASLVIWSSKQDKVVSAFTGLPRNVKNESNLSAIMDLEFSPTQDRLAVSSGFKINSTVTAWNPQKRELTTRFAGKQGTVWDLTYSPNGKLLAGAGDSLVIWDSESGAVLDTWRNDERDLVRGKWFHAYSVAFAPNGRLIACGGLDKTVKVFSVYEK